MREYHNKEAGRMGTYEYVVAQIDGDYARGLERKNYKIVTNWFQNFLEYPGPGRDRAVPSHFHPLLRCFGGR